MRRPREMTSGGVLVIFRLARDNEPAKVAIEARQLLTTVYDAMGNVEAAGEQALQVLEDIRRADARD